MFSFILFATQYWNASVAHGDKLVAAQDRRLDFHRDPETQRHKDTEIQRNTLRQICTQTLGKEKKYKPGNKNNTTNQEQQHKCTRTKVVAYIERLYKRIGVAVE